jgi:GNAT superfamily N-acetyltransferase
MKQLAQLCEEIIIKKFFFIPKFLDNNSFDESEDFILTKSPYHSSIFNLCWVKKANPIYFENSIRRAIDYFSPKPFALWFGPSSSSSEMEQTLSSLGFVKNTDKLGMVYDLMEYKSNLKSYEKNEIIEIKCEKELEHFLEVIEDSEPCTRGYFKKVIRDLGFSINKPYRYFYLSLSGKPICIASLFFHNETCGLFDLFTHPENRRLGYSLEILDSLLGYARSNGSKHMCLIASAPLDLDINKVIQIYKKLGFIEQGQYSCYEYQGSGF